jgi:transposase
MYEDLSRLLGLEGFVVTAVVERGGELDLEVELATTAACCPACGRACCEVKERPLVRVRDLPIAGRRTFLVWRKRRFRCGACGCTFTERAPRVLRVRPVSLVSQRHMDDSIRHGCGQEARFDGVSRRCQMASSSASAAGRGRRGEAVGVQVQGVCSA